MMMFQAVKKDSIPVQIVNYFLDAIASKELKENDRLPSERDLCAMLGVGRSTLREALRILELMSVIEKRSDGTYVHIQNNDLVKEAVSIDFAVGINNYAELVEVRNFLEIDTIALAAQNATAADIQVLRELEQQMRDSVNDVRKYAQYSTEFHIAIARATHNDILTEIFEAIRYVMYDYQKNNMRSVEETNHSFQEHVEMIGAIEAGDETACRRIMSRHLNYTQGLFERQSKPALSV